jgi:hypothetical protein
MPGSGILGSRTHSMCYNANLADFISQLSNALMVRMEVSQIFLFQYLYYYRSVVQTCFVTATTPTLDL